MQTSPTTRVSNSIVTFKNVCKVTMMKLKVGYCAYSKNVLLSLSIHLQVMSTLVDKLPIVEVVLADIAIVQVVVTLNCAGLAGSGAVEWRCWIM